MIESLQRHHISLVWLNVLWHFGRKKWKIFHVNTVDEISVLVTEEQVTLNPTVNNGDIEIAVTV